MGRRRLITRVVGLGAAWLLAVSAWGSCAGQEGGGDGGGAPSGDEAEKGFCADVCPKDCATDDDCATDQGELCCGLGSAGAVCLPAMACPRFCEDDTDCDSAAGLACLRYSLGTKDRVCIQPEKALKLCDGDGSCQKGDVCCPIYKEPICLPPEQCPKACAQSAECKTDSAEICCTAFTLRDAALAAGGLCVAPADEPCPKTCEKSSDCDTQKGELCCEGICATSCAKTCETSADCTGQVCCKSALAKGPSGGLVYNAGTTNCQTCAEYIQGGASGPICKGSLSAVEALNACACGATCGSECAGFCGVGPNGNCAGCLQASCSTQLYQCNGDRGRGTGGSGGSGSAGFGQGGWAEGGWAEGGFGSGGYGQGGGSEDYCCSCAEYFTPDVGCPDDEPFCAGSEQKLAAFAYCLCEAECIDECNLTCTSEGSDGDCQSCALSLCETELLECANDL